MKLARFDAGNGARTGVIVDSKIIDLVEVNAPYTEMEDIIHGHSDAVSKLADFTDGMEGSLTLTAAKLLAPIKTAGKYLAIGMNYKKHQEESIALGVKPPEHQVWFNKQTTCLNDPYGDIESGVTDQLDYEVELGLVIGRKAKSVLRKDALSHVFGFFVANDVSARDWQFHSPTFMMGKSFDTHGPIGPWIVTADEIADPHNLDLKCFVNDEVRQSSNTSKMLHRIEEQIEYLSTAFTLEPCDLIATGTPEGVGVALNPPVFLKSGDVVRCEVESIGSIENKVL